jgi:hypothetical protein
LVRRCAAEYCTSAGFQSNAKVAATLTGKSADNPPKDGDLDPIRTGGLWATTISMAVERGVYFVRDGTMKNPVKNSAAVTVTIGLLLTFCAVV